MVRKTVTVLFTDVARSTQLGERLDPEVLRGVMERFFEETKAVVERHGGTVEKFIGDAVMAVFGVPAVREDDAARAVRAAAELRDAHGRIEEDVRRTWGLELRTRVGVNTGEVVAGDAGDAQHLVTGDPVVVAKRLEESAPPGEVLIGEATRRLVRELAHLEPAALAQAKGKPDLRAWRLLAIAAADEPLRLRLDSPLVGRELELAALERTFEYAVAARECRLFTVVGPPGIGKSRLTHELIERLAGKARVLRGRCLPYGEGITFWPLVEIVRDAAGLRDGDEPSAAVAKIEALLPSHPDAAAVAERVASALGRAPSPTARPEETFWSVRQLLEALAAKRPLLVVLDDVQWAETTLLDLVEYLAGSSTGRALQLVCLARPELLELRPSWGLPGRRTAAISLGPLDEEQAGSLIRNLLDRLPFDPAVARYVAGASEGNPLFVEEFVRMLVDDGVLRRVDGGWEVGAELEPLAAPPSVQALLTARLDRLDPAERAVLQRAAVAGQVFSWRAVSELSPEAERDGVGACLQALVRKGLLEREPTPLEAEDALRFGHLLVRDAAYGTMPKETRAGLHERLARWLDGRGDAAEHADRAAFHLEQAARYRGELAPTAPEATRLAGEAVGRLASAARRALDRGDLPAGVNLLRRALALVPPGDPRRRELAPQLAHALRERGELAAAAEVLRETEPEAAAAGDDRALAWIRLERAWLDLYTDSAASAEGVLAVAREASAALERAGDHLGLARADRLEATVHWFRCRFGAMEEALERGLEHAERSGDQREQAAILSALTRAAFGGPRPAEEAIARCERIRERLAGDRVAEAEVAALLATLHAMCGRFDEARELLRGSTAKLVELGRDVNATANATYSGLVEQLAGDVDAAERELRPAYETLRAMGDRAHLSTIAAELARVLELRRSFEEAQHLTLVSERSAPADDLVSQVAWRGVRARLLARRGASRHAEATAREAVRLADETDYLDLRGLARFDLASVLRRAGRADEAASALGEALELWEAKGDLPMAGRARSLLLGEPASTPA